MQSQITIQAPHKQSIEPNPDKLSLYNFKLLKTASTEEFKFEKGHVLVQSISHYLAHIELFEYAFTQQASIDFTVNEPGFFMYADLLTGASHLCYHPAGKYRKNIVAGQNRIMLLTFRSDWLIYKCRKLTAINSLSELLYNPSSQPTHLPSVNIANILFKSLIKMDITVRDMNIDDDGYIFINGCINKYYNRLKNKSATAEYYQQKSADIAAFVKLKFATEEVESLPKLAARFMVSERSLARLAKIAFGIPLHEQVIKLRIHYALDLLLTTDKPIFEIAALSGYKEAYYFSKAFKKYFGTCPKSVSRPTVTAAELELQL